MAMKTLRLSGGDLVPGAGGFETVTGASRIMQDLRVALSEPLGIDRFHPGWGSRVDGFIGQSLDEATAFDLEQEVNRVVGNYVAVQAQKAAQDALRGTASRYTTADLVSYVSDLTVRFKFDQASITITIVTVSGDEHTTTIEVEPNG